MVGPSLRFILGSGLLALVAAAPGWAAPISVRYPEGVTHGFLVVRSPAGDVIAEGDLLQGPPSEGGEARLVFRVRAGSTYDDTALFPQQRVFTLLSYKLHQKGPSFPMEMHVSLSRERDKGRYQVRSRQERGDEHQKG